MRRAFAGALLAVLVAMPAPAVAVTEQLCIEVEHDGGIRIDPDALTRSIESGDASLTRVVACDWDADPRDVAGDPLDPWPPNRDLAARLVGSGDQDCDDLLGEQPLCWTLTVTATDGCPTSLIAQLHILDADGVIITTELDAVVALPPDTPVRFQMRTFAPGARTAQIATLDCF